MWGEKGGGGGASPYWLAKYLGGKRVDEERTNGRAPSSRQVSPDFCRPSSSPVGRKVQALASSYWWKLARAGGISIKSTVTEMGERGVHLCSVI